MISAKSIEQAYQVLKDVVVETSLVFDPICQKSTQPIFM
ncbi:Uncharacterised protein [Chlamydia trachomatis]|nr:Uncharacterised protein [Chlamydia trachomatis]